MKIPLFQREHHQSFTFDGGLFAIRIVLAYVQASRSGFQYGRTLYYFFIFLSRCQQDKKHTLLQFFQSLVDIVLSSSLRTVDTDIKSMLRIR